VGALNSVPVREGRVVLDGVSAPVLEAGPTETDEAAVFVHGNPGSAEDWRRLLGHAGEVTRAVAPGLPGFGRADKPAGFDYTISGYAEFLHGCLDQLGVKRAHLVVHDFGGPFAIEWASRHPAALASLVLINTPGLPTRYPWYLLARIWRTPVAGELLQATAFPPVFKILIRRGNPPDFPAAEVERMYRDFDAGTKRAVLKLYRATPDIAAHTPRWRRALSRLDIPVLAIWGRHDPYIPVEVAYMQRETFPRAPVHILERSGHWPMLDDPDAVARLLMPFLGEALRAKRVPEQ
jgi:pimeloyl-ACP methyl ester carboxylesterase